MSVVPLSAQSARSDRTYRATTTDADLSAFPQLLIRFARESIRAALGREGAGMEMPAVVNELRRELREGEPPGFRWTVEVLGLDEAERELLLMAAAIDLEPSLRVELSQLSGRAEWTYLTRALLPRLMGRPAPAVAFSGALFRWRMLVEHEVGPQDPPALSIDPFALSLVLDQTEWDPCLAARLRRIAPVEPLESWPVDQVVALVRRATQNAPARILIQGAEGSGRRSFARCVAQQLELPILFVDSEGLSDDQFADHYLRVQRQALVLGHAVVWSSDVLGRSWPVLPSLVPLSFVLGDAVSTLPRGAAVVDETVRLTAPEGDELEALWERFVPGSRSWSRAERSRLMGRYRVQMGDLVALSQRGVVTAEEAQSTCRALHRGRLGDYAELLDCPFERDDLVVSERLGESLDDFLHEAFQRQRFWQRPAARRLFPRGRGLVGLFSGPPGTGKTMAAQVIAAELGLDLLRIDLAKVVSKYIGETAKNLSRVFSQVREMNAVLFFDEADSLFSQRTDVKDAHDRYANSDTNYLLQHLEEFEGVALLATNRRANIDRAFLRRLRAVLEFTRPTATQREVIFRSLVGQLVENPDERLLGAGTRALAQGFELSGAQIKLAILSAIFTAGRRGEPVSVQHVFAGIERELAKEGRQIVRADQERLARAMGETHGV